MLHTIDTKTIDLQCLAFSPDGMTIATGAFNGEVKLWDTATGAFLETAKLVENHSVFSLSFSPNENAGDEPARKGRQALERGNRRHRVARDPVDRLVPPSFSADGAPWRST